MSKYRIVSPFCKKDQGAIIKLLHMLSKGSNAAVIFAESPYPFAYEALICPFNIIEIKRTTGQSFREFAVVLPEEMNKGQTDKMYPCIAILKTEMEVSDNTEPKSIKASFVTVSYALKRFQNIGGHSIQSLNSLKDEKKKGCAGINDLESICFINLNDEELGILIKKPVLSAPAKTELSSQGDSDSSLSAPAKTQLSSQGDSDSSLSASAKTQIFSQSDNASSKQLTTSLFYAAKQTNKAPKLQEFVNSFKPDSACGWLLDYQKYKALWKDREIGEVVKTIPNEEELRFYLLNAEVWNFDDKLCKENFKIHSRYKASLKSTLDILESSKTPGFIPKADMKNYIDQHYPCEQLTAQCFKDEFQMIFKYLGNFITLTEWNDSLKNTPWLKILVEKLLNQYKEFSWPKDNRAILFDELSLILHLFDLIDALHTSHKEHIPAVEADEANQWYYKQFNDITDKSILELFPALISCLKYLNNSVIPLNTLHNALAKQRQWLKRYQDEYKDILTVFGLFLLRDSYKDELTTAKPDDFDNLGKAVCNENTMLSQIEFKFTGVTKQLLDTQIRRSQAFKNKHSFIRIDTMAITHHLHKLVFESSQDNPQKIDDCITRLSDYLDVLDLLQTKHWLENPSILGTINKCRFHYKFTEKPMQSVVKVLSEHLNDASFASALNNALSCFDESDFAKPSFVVMLFKELEQFSKPPHTYELIKAVIELKTRPVLKLSSPNSLSPSNSSMNSPTTGSANSLASPVNIESPHVYSGGSSPGAYSGLGGGSPLVTRSPSRASVRTTQAIPQISYSPLQGQGTLFYRNVSAPVLVRGEAAAQPNNDNGKQP